MATGLAFLLPFGILVFKGVICPCRESAAEAKGEGSTAPRSGLLRGDRDKPEGAAGCREWGWEGERAAMD